jgi:hypothetical protein
MRDRIVAGLAFLALGASSASGQVDQKRIDEAIAKGAKWLRTQQSANGSFGGIQTTTSLQYDIGLSSLCGLALLAAGDKRGDASVDTVVVYAQEQDALRADSARRTTYDVGLLLMFLSEWQRSATKKAKPKDAAADPCQLSDEKRAWMQALAGWLAGARKQGTGSRKSACCSLCSPCSKTPDTWPARRL